MFNRFGPYHWARLEACTKEFGTVGIEICGKTRRYLWDPIVEGATFDRRTIFPDHSIEDLHSGEVSRGVVKCLDQVRPDVVVIPGWYERAALVALSWCQKTETPAVLMTESGEHDSQRTMVAEKAKQHVVSCFSSALVGGARHKAYLESLGMDPAQVFYGYDVVDNDYFARGAIEARRNVGSLRRAKSLPEHYFLASARFIPKKNLPSLIRAYGLYSKQMLGRSAPRSASSAPWHLVLLGEGPLRSDLVRLVAELGLDDLVYLPGFKQYDELPIYYGLARAFIHASTVEQWGLVVNEAMAAGLPVLVSERCGCASELVVDGANGFTFDPTNIRQLSQLMLYLSQVPGEPDRMSRASQEIISNWQPARFAEGTKAAILKALETGPVPATLSRRAVVRFLALR